MSAPRNAAQVERALELAVIAPAGWLGWLLGWVFAHRVRYPFDLEWMEGGMLAHAWRLAHGLPIYDPPSVDFVPFIYPPGYSVVVAALGQVFGLGLPLGRCVSAVSIVSAAAALAYAVRRAGGSLVVAGGAALAFLGTYPQAGAFYDIVRPDALAMALAGWSIALALDADPDDASPRARFAPIAAGGLLALGFLVKHNLAIVGLPLAVALAVRDRRAAARFVAASVVPAGLTVAALELGTGGRFLVWLLEVPSAHVMLWARAWIESGREWGTALPVAFAIVGLAIAVDAARTARSVPVWLAAGLPLWAGVLAGWWGTYEVPPPDAGVVPAAYGAAYFGIAAVIVGLGVRGLDALLARSLVPPEPGAWREGACLGVAGTLGVTAALMRAHDGGFVNVHMPLLFAVALLFGVALARRIPRAAWGRGFAALAVFAQLGWAASRIDRYALVPRAADVAVGNRFVDAIRAVDGPVLSPFSAWLPVYAGRPPSLHAMGVWDCNYPGGPFRDDLAAIQRGLRDHHWALIVGGQHQLLGDLTEHYEVVDEIIAPSDKAFWPRTGYLARPWRILAPRDETY